MCCSVGVALRKVTAACHSTMPVCAIYHSAGPVRAECRGCRERLCAACCSVVFLTLLATSSTRFGWLWIQMLLVEVQGGNGSLQPDHLVVTEPNPPVVQREVVRAAGASSWDQ